jgi:hypothetical protein
MLNDFIIATRRGKSKENPSKSNKSTESEGFTKKIKNFVDFFGRKYLKICKERNTIYLYENWKGGFLVKEKAPASTNSSKSKLIFVLVVVFIVCGGNGLGFLMGGLVWRATQKIGIAIAVMVGITLLAFGLAICVILACRHLAAGDQPSLEETKSVISEE